MCLLQENDEAVNGFYLMKKNGYKIKITPFKELGFSMYDGSDL